MTDLLLMFNSAAFNVFVGIFGTIMGIIGTVLTIKYSKSKKPKWCDNIIPLFSNRNPQIENLYIEYKGEKVENLSRIYVAFWNAGRETITKDNISKELIYSLNNGNNKIYDAQIIENTNDSTLGSQFKIEIINNDTAVKLSFEKLDYKDGVIVQIMSDLNRNEYSAFVSGKISESKIVKFVQGKIFIIAYLATCVGISIMAIIAGIFFNELSIAGFSLTTLFSYIFLFALIGIPLINDILKIISNKRNPKNGNSMKY